MNRNFPYEMSDFEDYLISKFDKSDRISNEVSKKLLISGGKRLRPFLTLAFSNLGENFDKEIAFKTAAAIEMLHTATLVHDDIVDESSFRRNTKTINEKYGNHMAVYVGDFLLLKSIKELTETLDFYDSSSHSKEKILKLFNNLFLIIFGEIEQYNSKFQEITFFDYLKRIRRKTAILFGLSAVLGAFNSKLDEKSINRAFKFGIEFGMAFQIKDDIKNFGEKDDKPVGNDIKNGNFTLPVIISLNKNPEFRKILQDSPLDKSSSLILCKQVLGDGSIGDSYKIMNKYVERARKTILYFDNQVLSLKINKLLDTLS